AAPVAQKPVDAVVQVPGSKSLTARWMLLAAIADEPSRLRGALVSRDTRLMADALERLGATLRFEDAALQVTPLPLPSQRPAEPTETDTGRAATAMRFVPLLAALRRGGVRFPGDEAALARPMGPVRQVVRARGGRVTEPGEEGRLPLTVHGPGQLPGGRVEV